MTTSGRAFLTTLVGEFVRVTPDNGRAFIGRLTAVEGSDQEPVLHVNVNGDTWDRGWSHIERLQLCTPRPTGEAT